MSYKKILVCDQCGKQIKRSEDKYNISKIKAHGEVVFTSDTYTDAAGDRDYDVRGIDLCKRCTNSLLDYLEEFKNGDK